MGDTVPLVRFISNWAPVVLWMGVIYLLSAQPSLPPTPSLPHDLLSRAGHFGEYLALGWLLARTAGVQPSRRHLIALLAVAIAYAVSDEFHQSFVPNRAAAVDDIVFDVLGASAGMVAGRWFSRSPRRRSQPIGDARRNGYNDHNP